MIKRQLNLNSEKGDLSKAFPENGILYQCAGPEGYFLSPEPSGTVLCAFILSGKTIFMTEQASGGVPGVAVKKLAGGQTASIGLCEYKVRLSRKLVMPSKRKMIVAGAVCFALFLGSFVSMVFGGREEAVAKPVAVREKVQEEDKGQATRFDRLLKQDEGQGGVHLEKEVTQADVLSEVDSREAFQLYEKGLALLDSGKYSEAADKLAKAKNAAGKLPITPPYLKMIDEGISRARSAMKEAQAAAIAEIRTSIEKASTASPGESLKIIAAARVKIGSASKLSDAALKSALEDLDKLHRSKISALLAKANTLERLEGCRAAQDAYKETLGKYGSLDERLSQAVRIALDRCGGGGS